MSLTPHSQLQQWLVLVLGAVGGTASRAEALNLIEQRFARAFTAADIEPVPSRQWEPKWRNRVSWQRDRMVKRGLLKPYAGPGTPWSLTEGGWDIYRELTHETDDYDPLAHFKPKSSEEYRARISEQTLIKRRTHEQLVADFGRWAIDGGYSARPPARSRAGPRRHRMAG